MADVDVLFLGSGDAFGSGGRLQTCILVSHPGGHFLIDCGTTALIAMRRYGIDPGEIDAILLTHLHGDHFGGLPYLVLDGQFFGKRTRPLVVTGPPGTAARVESLMEVVFPGSTQVKRNFDLDIRELDVEVAADVREAGDIRVTPYEVVHACGCVPFALRIDCAGRTITYTGDTEWTESLVAAGHEADLLIAEAYFYDKRVKYHLDYATLIANLPRIAPRRLVLTHMSTDMLGRLDEVTHETADDGLRLTL
jgi:ribonuclease BN (tRNA processing enzyme)